MLIDQFAFVDEPKTGPALVYRRQLAEATDDALLRKFGSNTASSSEMFVVDVSDVEPMRDSEFWPLVTNRDVNSVTEELIGRGAAATRSFQVRLLELVSRLQNSTLGAEQLGGEDYSVEIVACGLVLRGQDEFESALSGHVVRTPLDFGPEDDALLGAAAEAYSQIVGTKSLVEFLDKLQNEAPVERPGVKPTVAAAGEDLEARARKWREMYTPDLINTLWGEPDEVWDECAARGWAWVTGRVIVRFAGTLEECLVLVGVPYGEGYDFARSSVVQRLRDEGMISLISQIDLYDTHWARAYPDMSGVFVISHRIRGLSQEEYLDRFF